MFYNIYRALKAKNTIAIIVSNTYHFQILFKERSYIRGHLHQGVPHVLAYMYVMFPLMWIYVLRVDDTYLFDVCSQPLLLYTEASTTNIDGI